MVLVLVCPEGNGPEKLPLIVGTNARAIRHAPRSGEVQGDPKLARTMHVSTQLPTQSKSLLPHSDPLAVVKQCGPGPLTVPPGSERSAICKVLCNETLEDGMLVVETPSNSFHGALPAGSKCSVC